MCPDWQLPLTELDWLLFHQWMRDTERLVPGTSKQYVNNVNYFLECIGYPQPNWASMRLKKRVNRRQKGLIQAKACRKQPVHWGLVKQLVDIADVNRVDVPVFLAILCLGVAGFFRLGELLVKKKKKMKVERVIRVGHIQFYPSRVNPEYLSLFLPFSKVDKYFFFFFF